MRWTYEHDVMLMREVLLHEPWMHRRGSPERGKVWDKIAESLNGLNTTMYFKVTQRSVRDRYNLLVENYKKKEREEARASGIDAEETELDQSVADAIERFREADENHQQESEEKKGKIEADTKKAIEMRKRSLETFGETKERNGEEVKCKRARNSGSETIQYLREKSENELKLREEELQQR